MSEQDDVIKTPVSPGWRPKVGLFLFILALASLLLAPLVLATDLPREMKASIAGLLMFGVPMALMLAVVAVVGQPAFLFLKSRVAKQGIPSPVSVMRYRIGLALLIIPVIVSWLGPLVASRVPEIEARRVLIGAVADGMVLISLFVLSDLLNTALFYC